MDSPQGQELIVTYITLHLGRFPGFATPPGPSRLLPWFDAALRLFGSRRVAAPPMRDRVREACEVRARAEKVRATDPRFAADLFAAADRHERQGG